MAGEVQRPGDTLGVKEREETWFYLSFISHLLPTGPGVVCRYNIKMS